MLAVLSFPLALVSAVAMLWAVNPDMFMGLLAAFSPFTAIGLTALSAIAVDLFPTSLRSVGAGSNTAAGGFVFPQFTQTKTHNLR